MRTAFRSMTGLATALVVLVVFLAIQLQTDVQLVDLP